MFMLVLLMLALVGLLAFIYRYGRYSPWRRYRQGRMLMLQKVFLSIAVIYLIIDALVEGPWPGEEPLLYVVTIGIVIAIWGMFFSLMSSQRQDSTTAEKISGMTITPDDDLEPKEVADDN